MDNKYALIVLKEFLAMNPTYAKEFNEAGMEDVVSNLEAQARKDREFEDDMNGVRFVDENDEHRLTKSQLI